MSSEIPFKFKKRGYLRRVENDLPAAKWLKGNGNWRFISAITLTALIHNYFVACKKREIGHGSARWTYSQLCNIISHIDIPIKLEWLEEMLYASNMLNEINKYQHPLGTPFEKMLSRIITKKEYFDLITNTIETKHEAKKE